MTKKEKIKLHHESFYEGETKDGTPHGKGVITFPDGSILEGQWKIGVFFGEKFACFEYSILLAVSFICFILIGILINNYIIISTMAFSFLVGIFLIIKIFNYRKVNLNNLLEKTAQFTFLNALLFSVSVWIAVLSDSSI